MSDTQPVKKKRSWWTTPIRESMGKPEKKSVLVVSEKPKVHGLFQGVAVNGTEGIVYYDGKTYPLPAHAVVESQGEMSSRITATRLLAVGVFALALKKKKDQRELFLTVEGEGWAFVVDVNPKKQMQAREFAAKVNSA